MKTIMILRTIVLLVLMASLFAMLSCSKNADQSMTKEQKAQQDSNIVVSTIDVKDITESEEDLTTVDYKEFYDQLSPYGEWAEVSLEEIGLQSKTTSLRSSDNNHSVIADILGVKTAYADASVVTTFVWKPSPEYAMVSTVGQATQYAPYSNGQWVNTDAGWYFKAPTPWEETVHHQGRWVNSPSAGWMWVPGRVWAPAWVDWRQNDEYVSWAPLRPAVYYNTAGGFSSSVISNDDYAIVERGRFLEPDIYRYSSPYYENGNRISMDLFTGMVGLVVADNMIINRGPDVNVIQTYYPNNIINVVNIRPVKNYNEVRYSEKEYFVYRPEFKRYKNKDHKEYKKNVPKSYKSFAEWKDVKNEQKEYNKEVKKQEKEFKKEVKNQQKEYKKEYKNNENGKKNSGNENIKYEKGNKSQNKNKENVKQNKGNNEKQNKENVKQSKGNDKGNQQKGGNDKGNKQKGK
jgi:hypothetical protein